MPASGFYAIAMEGQMWIFHQSPSFSRPASGKVSSILECTDKNFAVDTIGNPDLAF